MGDTFYTIFKSIFYQLREFCFISPIPDLKPKTNSAGTKTTNKVNTVSTVIEEMKCIRLYVDSEILHEIVRGTTRELLAFHIFV